MTEARQKPQPQKKAKKNSWKKEYLRILLNGPASPDDYPVAAELIKRKLANGTYLPNPRAANGIANLTWRGVTMEGRHYAETLQSQIKQEAWHRPIWLGIGGVAVFTFYWFWEEVLNYLRPTLLGS